MNEFWKRAFSALVFVIIVIFLVVYSSITLTIFGILVSSVCIAEGMRMNKINDTASILFLQISNFILLFSAVPNDYIHSHIAVGIVLTIFILYLTFQLFKNGIDIIHKISNSTFILVYITLPFYCFMTYSLQNASDYDWQRPMLVLLLVWASDTFAYLCGRTFGKHLLFEILSPKKTVEGLIGGTIFAAITGYILSIYWDFITPLDGVILGILVSIFGTIGDLFESALKRKAEVKDSGKIMPGHGGILDRFDAFIFASLVVYIWFGFK